MTEIFNTAWRIFQTARDLADVTKERWTDAYEVSGPTTVYVRGSHCRLTVERAAAPRVQVEGEMQQSFGWDWVTERDDAGIYVVLKRRRLVGALSYAALRLVVPPDAYLVFHLTPGSVVLADFEGQVAVASLAESLPVSATVAPAPGAGASDTPLAEQAARQGEDRMDTEPR